MPSFVLLVSRVVLLIVVIGLAAACSSSAAVPTFTPVPAVSAPVQASAAQPTTAPTDIPDTPVARGEVLFKTYLSEAGFACSTCHYPTSDKRLIGPGLKDVAARVEEYGLTLSAEEYVHEAIVSPRNFIAPGDPAYAPNAMPAKYGEILTEDELDDLIQYVLSL